MSWYRIKARLLTESEKEWFEQVLSTVTARVTRRNKEVFLRHLKCGTLRATGDYFGMTREGVRVHVALVLHALERRFDSDWYKPTHA